MISQTRKLSIKQIVSLITVTSTSIFLGFPALALNNSNFSSSKEFLNNRNRSVDSTAKTRQLVAQNTPITGQNTTGQTGTGQTGTGQTGTGQFGTGTGQTGTGQFGTGTGQTGTGTGQNSTGQTGTGQRGRSQTGTSNTGGTGTGQRTGTSNTGTNRTGTNATNTGTVQLNTQQNAFTQYMLAGYAATNERDYQTALTNFRRALQLRPGNPYATRAISNVQGYLQRSGG